MAEPTQDPEVLKAFGLDPPARAQPDPTPPQSVVTDPDVLEAFGLSPQAREQRPTQIRDPFDVSSMEFGLADLEPQPPGAAESFARGLARGGLGLAEAVGSGLKFAGATELGETVRSYWAEKAKAFDPHESIQGDVIDNPALLANGSWLAYNVGQIAPSLLASIIPGAGAARGVQIAGKAYQWTPQLVEKLARLGGAIVGGTVGGSLEGAHTFEEVLKKGGTLEQARAAGTAMTLASGVLNALSVGKVLKKPSAGVSGRIRKFFEGAGTEGLTEYLEEPAEGGILMGLGETAEGEPFMTPEEFRQKLKSGANVIVPAAITGGLAGAAFPGVAEGEAEGAPGEAPPPRAVTAEDVIGRPEPPPAGPTAPGMAEPVLKPEASERPEDIVLPPNFDDSRLKRPVYREALQGLSDELVAGGAMGVVWSEDQMTVEGRTPSQNPDWFKDRGWTVKETRKAVRKALAGKKLGKRQRNIVGAMLDEATDRRVYGLPGTREPYVEQVKARREDLRIARSGFPPLAAYGQEGEVLGTLYDERDYEPDWDEATRQFADLVYDAQAVLGEDEVVDILTAHERDGIPEAESARVLAQRIKEAEEADAVHSEAMPAVRGEVESRRERPGGLEGALPGQGVGPSEERRAERPQAPAEEEAAPGQVEGVKAPAELMAERIHREEAEAAQKKTKELVSRIDNALARMREKHGAEIEQHDAYKRLQSKRDAVAAGAKAEVKEVSEELIGEVGKLIGDLTKATGLKRPDLPKKKGIKKKPKVTRSDQPYGWDFEQSAKAVGLPQLEEIESIAQLGKAVKAAKAAHQDKEAREFIAAYEKRAKFRVGGEAVHARREPEKPEPLRIFPYASGMSRQRDFRAALESKAGVGVEILEMSKPLMDVAAQAVAEGKDVFVDSGAFRVFKAAQRAARKGDTLPMAINFDVILDKYRELSDLVIEKTTPTEKTVQEAHAQPRLHKVYNRAGLMLVMPDVVGDQAATFALLEKHKEIILEFMSRRHEVIIPLQQGEKTISESYEDIVKLLDGDRGFVVGIPSNVAAIPKQEFSDLLRDHAPPRIHILGAVAEKNLKARADAILAQYAEELPGVTADANVMRSRLDKLKGLKGEKKFNAIVKLLNEVVPEGSDAVLMAPETEVDQAAHEAQTSPFNEKRDPTEGEIEAGNYEKGHLRVHGVGVSIESPAGTKRRPEWPPLAYHYGDLKGTVGADGDPIDVFIGPEPANDYPVFVVNQNKANGKFDEHKVMAGFKNAQAAEAGYLANYDPDWKKKQGGKIDLVELSAEEFKAWKEYGDHSKRAKKPKNIDEIRVSRKATIEETGEEVQVELPAVVALEHLSKRISLLESLKGCIR